MKGNVFQCHGESANKQQFLKTVGVLEEHINKTFEYPQDVASVCKTFEVVKLTVPANLDAAVYSTDMAQRMIWETTMKTYMKRTDKMEGNLRGIYAIVWGQSSPLMQSKLESLDDYAKKSTACDCVWLLKEIQAITHRFEGTRMIYISLDDAWESYYTYRQGAQQSTHEYMKEFQAIVQVLEHYGAAIGADGPYLDSAKEKLKTTLLKAVSDKEILEKAMAAAKLKSIATGFMKRADKRRYGALWSDLENQFTRGQDHYPDDLTAAYHMLLNYQPAPVPQQQRRRDDDETSGLSFLQNGSPVPGTDGEIHNDIKCYNCNKQGHYASSCPDTAAAGVQMLQLGESTHNDPDDDAYESAFTFLNLESNAYTFAQASNLIPSSLILLDSQSTVSVFKNHTLLTNIRPSPRPLRMHTNGGTQLSTQMGHVRNLATCGTTPTHSQISFPWPKCARCAASPWTPLWNPRSRSTAATVPL
jgi:hypothetical protein